jgi:hypothetical protein
MLKTLLVALLTLATLPALAAVIAEGSASYIPVNLNRKNTEKLFL